MRLKNDEYLIVQTKKTLQQTLINANKFKNEISVDEMKINLKI